MPRISFLDKYLSPIAIPSTTGSKDSEKKPTPTFPASPRTTSLRPRLPPSIPARRTKPTVQLLLANLHPLPYSPYRARGNGSPDNPPRLQLAPFLRRSRLRNGREKKAAEENIKDLPDHCMGRRMACSRTGFAPEMRWNFLQTLPELCPSSPRVRHRIHTGTRAALRSDRHPTRRYRPE